MPLNHVALTVTDRERAAAFYAAHFGLRARVHSRAPADPRPGRTGRCWRSEGAAPAAALPSTNHFGFQLADRAAVFAAREGLQRAGVPETGWQDDPGMARVQVADPDGYRLELYALDVRP